MGRGWRWRERGDRGGRGGKQERGVEIKIEFEGKSEFEVGLEFLTYDGFKLFKYLEYFIGSLMQNNNQNGWLKKNFKRDRLMKKYILMDKCIIPLGDTRL